MLKNEDNRKEVTLWIIRWQNFLSRLFHSKLLASVFTFYVPIIITGYIFQVKYGYKIFSRGVFIALLWIAFAPLLIQNVLKLINTFFYTHKHIFRNQGELETLRNNEIKRIQSSRYLLFGLPWGIIISAVILYSSYNDAPFLIQFWAGISFFILFFVSSIGFYGIYVLITMMRNICAADILFNPFHPDKFGGISDFGRFAVKGALYFSSGALVFPLAFEIIANISNGSNFLTIAIYCLAGFFTSMMFASFLIPILQIKKFVDPKKEHIILDSRDKLDKMIAEFKKGKDLDIKQGVEILMYYYFNHSKLLEIKDYPWDFRVLIEFGLSFFIPIGVAILQIFFR